MSTPEFAPADFHVMAIADDVPPSRLEISQWEDLGYRVTVYQDLETALVGIRQFQPQIILCDHRFGDSGASGLQLMRAAVAAGIGLVMAISGAYVQDQVLPAGVVNATGAKTDVLRMHQRIWDAVRKINPDAAAVPPPTAPRHLWDELRQHILTLAECIADLQSRLDEAIRLAGSVTVTPSDAELGKLIMDVRLTANGLKTRYDWADPAQRQAYLRAFGEQDARAGNLPAAEAAGLPRSLHNLANLVGLIDYIRPDTLPLRLRSAIAAGQVPDEAASAIEAWLAEPDRLSDSALAILTPALRAVPEAVDVEPSYLRTPTAIDSPSGYEFVLVEDEKGWRDTIAADVGRFFRSCNEPATVRAFGDGQSALSHIETLATEYRARQRMASLAETPEPEFSQAIFCIDLYLGDGATQGLDLIKRIRELALPVPVIVLTSGSDSQETRESIRLLAVEAPDYIVKGSDARLRLKGSLERLVCEDNVLTLSHRGGDLLFDGILVDLTESEKSAVLSMNELDSGYDETTQYTDCILQRYQGAEHIITVASLALQEGCRSIADPAELENWMLQNYRYQWNRFVDRAQFADRVALLELLREILDLRDRLVKTESALQNEVYSIRQKVRTTFQQQGRWLNPFRGLIIQGDEGYWKGWQEETYGEVIVDEDDADAFDDVTEEGQGRAALQALPRLGLGGRPTRVLVLEDDPDWSKLIVSTLQKWRCDVSAASNVQDAVMCALEERPDMLCVDLRVPHYDGDESNDRSAGICFLQIVMSQLASSRAIILSEWTSIDELATAAERAGVSVHDFLAKGPGWNDRLLKSVWRLEFERARGVFILPPVCPPPIVEISDVEVRANGTALTPANAPLLRRLAEAWPDSVLMSELRNELRQDLRNPVRRVRDALLTHLAKEEQKLARNWVIEEKQTSDGAAYLLNAVVRRV